MLKVLYFKGLFLTAYVKIMLFFQKKLSNQVKQEDLKREEAVKALFASEDIIRKGLLTDEMYMYTWSKEEAIKSGVCLQNISLECYKQKTVEFQQYL